MAAGDSFASSGPPSKFPAATDGLLPSGRKSASRWSTPRFSFPACIFEPVKPPLPELPIAFYPFGGLSEGISPETTGTRLRLAAPLNQPGSFKHFEVLRYCGHVERFCQLGHRRLT